MNIDTYAKKQVDKEVAKAVRKATSEAKRRDRAGALRLMAEHAERKDVRAMAKALLTDVYSDDDLKAKSRLKHRWLNLGSYVLSIAAWFCAAEVILYEFWATPASMYTSLDIITVLVAMCAFALLTFRLGRDVVAALFCKPHVYLESYQTDEDKALWIRERDSAEARHHSGE